VISLNGLLSSLWVWQHKDESNPFLFQPKKLPLHVTFEQSQKLKRQNEDFGLRGRFWIEEKRPEKESINHGSGLFVR